MIYQEQKSIQALAHLHPLFNRAEITYLTQLEPKYLFSFTVVNVYLCCLAYYFYSKGK